MTLEARIKDLERQLAAGGERLDGLTVENEDYAQANQQLSQALGALEADLKLNASMLAHQCDMAREAEAVVERVKSTLAMFEQINSEPAVTELLRDLLREEE